MTEIIAGLVAIYTAYEKLRPMVLDLLAALKGEHAAAESPRIEAIFHGLLPTELQQAYLDENVRRAEAMDVPEYET